MLIEIRGEVADVETFASGKGRWQKRKGFADVRLPNGTIRKAELHWYEANGFGKREFKIKRFVE